MTVKKITPEELATIDLELKKHLKSKSSLSVDDLILISKDNQSLNKLKKAIVLLTDIEQSLNISEELKAEFKELIQKQIRSSVNRAKSKSS